MAEFPQQWSRVAAADAKDPGAIRCAAAQWHKSVREPLAVGALAWLLVGCGLIGPAGAAGELGRLPAEVAPVLSGLAASLAIAPDFAAGVPGGEAVHAVATFESLSLYWRPGGDGAARDCHVRYRPVDTVPWHRGFPLWYDARNGECRGSLVSLTADTEYEVEVIEPASRRLARTRARTWSESFPVARTVYLPKRSEETLTIEESGSPAGYLLFTHRSGEEATIDVGGRSTSNVVVKGSYVIIRGLRLQNAAHDAIRIEHGVHDVVVEENDISGWGRVSADGWGENMDAAIHSHYADAAPVARLVIQRNRIHHPRSGANAWDEYRRERDSSHPIGPQAISLWNTDGNHVIRYNEIYSDDDHKFNDCLGGGSNFSERGFPHRDSDIYGNSITHCWDDAIESEGGNVNVRIWGNYIDNSYVMVASAATQIGPLYIWRNVSDRSRLSATRDMKRAKRGVFLKAQSKNAVSNRETGERQYFGDGRIYVFHNTLVQRQGENDGVYAGLADLSGTMSNVTSRNNILQVNAAYRSSIADSERVPNNDFDYDLFNGKIASRPEQEANGIGGEPLYASESNSGPYALDPSSPGFDAGLILPNFSDGFVGKAPDIGAQEEGAPPLQFGADAYRQIAENQELN